MPSEAISYFKTHLCWFYILGLPDNNFIKKVQRLIYNFIWGKPKELSGLPIVNKGIKGCLGF